MHSRLPSFAALLAALVALAATAAGQTLTVSSGTTTISSGSSSYSLVDVYTTLNQSGGTVTATTGKIGAVGAEGRYTLSGGTASFGELLIAPARFSTTTMAYGTLVVTDGNLNATSLVLSDTSSYYLQSRVYQSGGTVTAGSVKIGSGSGNNAAYYLSGGTLATGGITASSNSPLRLLYMNGGTIRATAHNDNFINSTINTMVGGNGVTFDTNGYNIGFHGGFVRDPDDPALGVVTKAGTGTLTLYGHSTFTGGFRLQGGTLSVSTHDNLGPAAAPLTFDGGTLRVTSTAVADFGARSFNASTFNGGLDIAVAGHTFTIAHVLSGAGTFTKAGIGTVELSGANTLAGATVSAGTLRITGSFTGNIANNAALVFDRASALTYASVISGTGSLTKAGTGTLTLSAVNTHTGGTTVNDGTLLLAVGGQAGAIRGALTINAGATVLSTVNNTLGWGSGTRVTSVTINGGTLNHTSSGSHGFAGAYTLNGATMTSNGGVSSTTAASHFSIDGTSSFNVAGATASTIAGRMDLRGDGGYTNVNFTVADGSALNVSAGISTQHGVGFTKLGAGTMTLNGANTYTGATNVSAGTLVVNGSLANTAVSIASGAILGGSGSVGGLATFASGAHLAPGNSPGTLTFTNGLTLDGGSIVDFEVGAASDLLRISGGTLTGPSSGTVTINLTDSGGFAANTYVLFDFTGAALSDFSAADFALGTTIAGYDYSFNLTSTSLELVATAIPESSTYAALLGAASLGLVIARRRQRRLSLAVSRVL